MARHGGFIITCPECLSKDCDIDGFLVESLLTYSRTLALPLIVCNECGYEWNPRLATEEN